MAKRAAIILCDENELLREGKASFLRERGYRVAFSVPVLDPLLESPKLKDKHVLFVLGSQRLGETELEALSSLRSVYPKSPIVLLVGECTCAAKSEAEARGANGVLLRSISWERLLMSLDLIMMGEHVFTAMPDEGTQFPVPNSNGSECVLGRVNEALATAPETVKTKKCPADEAASDGAASDQVDSERSVGEDTCEQSTATAPADVVPSLSRREELSEREEQILHYLVDGHPNKVIARRCNITESTVKVHLKAILRKVHAANRTQAAIWAVNQMKKEGKLVASRQPDRSDWTVEHSIPTANMGVWTLPRHDSAKYSLEMGIASEARAIAY